MLAVMGQIILNEIDKTGTITGKYNGYYENGVYSGSFYAYHSSKTYEFYLYEM